MMRGIIVDDEQHCTDRIARLLASHCAGRITLLPAVSDVDAAFEAIERDKPDVVFLDVQIGKQTGFDLLHRFGHIGFDVVFTTAHEHYAIQAIKFSAVDYLLKPIDVDDLVDTVGRLAARRQQAAQPLNVNMLLQNLAFSQSQSKKVAIPTLTGFSLVAVNDIVRCRSDVNYTTIYLQDKSELVVAKTLKEFEILLTPYGFCRIHNSHLVNAHYIRHYHKGKGGYVILEDGTEVEVSVRRKEALLANLQGLQA